MKALRATTSRQAMMALGVLHVVAVGLLVASGGLFIDDIRAQAYAAGRPIWPFIIESNETHLAPGARTVDWFMATFAPLEHWPAVLITLVIASLYAATTIRLVSQVIASPTARLVAEWWILFGASVIPTFAWFRQALTTMLSVTLVMAIMSFTISFMRTGQRRFFVAAAVLHALTLGFSERALAVPVAVLAILICHQGRDLRALRHWRRTILVMAPHVVINIAFLSVYLSGNFDKAAGAQPSFSDAAIKLGRWLTVDLLPSFLGGPLVWRPGIPPYSFANTPRPLVALTAVAAIGGLVAAWRSRAILQRAWPVLAVSMSYSIPVVGLVYVGRLAQVRDVTSIDDLRLLPDVSVAAALALGALIGAAFDHRHHAATASRRAISGRVLAARNLVVGVFVVATAVSWVNFGLSWHRTPVKPYLANMREALSGSKEQVLPTALPGAVVPAWVDPDLTTEPLIRLLNPAALRSAMSASPKVITASGELGRARFTRVERASVPGGFCGKGLPAGEQSVSLPLDANASYYRGSIISVGLLVGDAVRINLSVVDDHGQSHGPLVAQPPELLRGPHRVQAMVPRGVVVQAIEVHAATPNTDGVCVTSAEIAAVGGPR